MLLDMRNRTETQRRLVTVVAAALLLAGIVWVLLQTIERAEAAEALGLWRRFAVSALITAFPMGAFVWKKLSDPTFADWRIDPRRYFWLLLGLGALFRRQFLDTPGAVSLVAGAAVGYVGATLFVYLYDVVTNSLSKGRSWHYPSDPTQGLGDGHSSNTSSPA